MPSQILVPSDSQPPLWQAQGMQCSKLQGLKTASVWFLTLLEEVSCSSETPGSAAELKWPEALSGTVTRVLHSHSCFCWVIRGSELREEGARRRLWVTSASGRSQMSIRALSLPSYAWMSLSLPCVCRSPRKPEQGIRSPGMELQCLYTRAGNWTPGLYWSSNGS